MTRHKEEWPMIHKVPGRLVPRRPDLLEPATICWLFPGPGYSWRPPTAGIRSVCATGPFQAEGRALSVCPTDLWWRSQAGRMRILDCPYFAFVHQYSGVGNVASIDIVVSVLAYSIISLATDRRQNFRRDPLAELARLGLA